MTSPPSRRVRRAMVLAVVFGGMWVTIPTLAWGAVASPAPTSTPVTAAAMTPSTASATTPPTVSIPQVYVRPGAGLVAPAATTSPSRPLGKFLGLGALVLMLVLYSEGFGLLGGRFRSLSSRPDPTASEPDA